MAVGLLNGLFAAGKSVPEDFEIITSNDSPITSYTRPNLSSINHPLYDLGAVSMRMLTKIMHKEELEDRTFVLNHGLTLRRINKIKKGVGTSVCLNFSFLEKGRMNDF